MKMNSFRISFSLQARVRFQECGLRQQSHSLSPSEMMDPSQILSEILLLMEIRSEILSLSPSELIDPSEILRLIEQSLCSLSSSAMRDPLSEETLLLKLQLNFFVMMDLFPSLNIFVMMLAENLHH
jgi:hypothetical protein